MRRAYDAASAAEMSDEDDYSEDDIDFVPKVDGDPPLSARGVGVMAQSYHIICLKLFLFPKPLPWPATYVYRDRQLL